MELIRLVLAVLFFASGLFILGVATLGLYRLGYVLNRIHASAKCDTLGAMLVLLGICCITGVSFTTLKLIMLIVFIWLTNPVAAHMIGRAEVLTNPYLRDEVEVVER
ncbi:MAG: monovalent cation/H(+) antiporter subunit G [Treponema sp.]|nr:monovalent cation/H(+) antiporter subunit G [Treponema sp.]